jgi:hypothetical protein
MASGPGHDHERTEAVITNAATGNPKIKALVYVNAFAPDEGETPTALAGPDSAVTEYDGGHLGLLSDPRTVAQGIERAARHVR